MFCFEDVIIVVVVLKGSYQYLNERRMPKETNEGLSLCMNPWKNEKGQRCRENRNRFSMTTLSD